MYIYLIVTVVAALAISSLASFFSRRFLPGFLLPFGGLLVLMLFLSAYQGGWELQGFLTVFAWDILVIIFLCLPTGLASAVGALLGIALSKKSEETRKRKLEVVSIHK